MAAVTYLDDALAHWAHKTPQAAALRVLGDETSYAALDAQVNAIAVQLVDAGVQRGDRVVVCAQKAPATIAAIHAVLRVAAAYVPIDPAAPPARVSSMLTQIEPACVVADRNTHARIGDALTSLPRIELGSKLPEAAGDGTIRERTQNRSPEDLAYVLMTSGSTGTPKGIEHTHCSGLAYATMAADLCGLTAADRVSHHTPLHFDMSIFDIFSTIIAGGTIVIIPEMYAKVPASLAKLAEDEGITVWYSVPFSLIQMVERGALESRDLSALRTVMFAGETMPPAMLKSFAKHVPNARFMNAYGPTETNHCTTAVFDHDDLDGESPLPIGFPDRGTVVRIGEEAEEPESGELLISTEQVMRGYWNDPFRTGVCFVDLNSGADGHRRRFYRSGDLVRRRADGSLMLLGRIDRQIKLRGFRIELDEIELALVKVPGINEAAVVFTGDEIWSFVTGPSARDTDRVAAHIASQLPTYAVPARIVAVDEMKRTSTGKIDRMRMKEVHDLQSTV